MMENRAQRALIYVLAGLIILYTLFPFYWALNSSFKTENEMIGLATFLPQNPTLINYDAVFGNQRFMTGLFNSALVAGLTVIFALGAGSVAAYALGRLEFRGREIMLYLILSMTMFPQISLLSGLFRLITNLNLFGTLGALLLVYPIFTLPFTIWVLTSFFRGLPSELEDAAFVDGASPFQTFYKILLPLTAPALVSTGLLTFVAAWNEYLFALTFTLINPASQTVTVAVAMFNGRISRQEPIAELMTAAVIVIVPLVILVLIFQRRIVQGLTAGAVKG